MFWPAIIYGACNLLADKANNRPTPQSAYPTGYRASGHEMPKSDEDKIVKFVDKIQWKDAVAWNVFDRLDKFHRYYPYICAADYFGGWRGMLPDGTIDLKKFYHATGKYLYDGQHGAIVGMLCLTYGKLSRSYLDLYKKWPMELPLCDFEIDQSILPPLACFYDDVDYFIEHGEHRR